MKLTREIKGNMKTFYKFVRSKGKTKTMLGCFLNAEGYMVMCDAEKTEVFHTFTSIFRHKVSCQMLSTVGSRDRERNNQLKTGKEQVRNYIEKLFFCFFPNHQKSRSAHI